MRLYERVQIQNIETCTDTMLPLIPERAETHSSLASTKKGRATDGSLS